MDWHSRSTGDYAHSCYSSADKNVHRGFQPAGILPGIYLGFQQGLFQTVEILIS